MTPSRRNPLGCGGVLLFTIAFWCCVLGAIYYFVIR